MARTRSQTRPARRNKRLPKLPAAEPGWADYASGARSAIFSDAFVEGLAKRFKIEAGRIPGLHKALEAWADIYRVYKWAEDDWPRTGNIKAELRLLRSRIDDLRETLLNLHPATEAKFWLPEHSVEFPPFSEEQVFISPYGHTMLRIPTGPSDAVLFHIDRSRHFESLTILLNYADAALSRMRNDQGGRARSEALRMWVVNVKNYWEGFLGRKFTVKKDGAAFCIEAFKPVDPSVSEARLVTAMRQVVEGRSKSSSARTPSK